MSSHSQPPWSTTHSPSRRTISSQQDLVRETLDSTVYPVIPQLGASCSSKERTVIHQHSNCSVSSANAHSGIICLRDSSAASEKHTLRISTCREKPYAALHLLNAIAVRLSHLTQSRLWQVRLCNQLTRRSKPLPKNISTTMTPDKVSPTIISLQAQRWRQALFCSSNDGRDVSVYVGDKLWSLSVCQLLLRMRTSWNSPHKQLDNCRRGSCSDGS
jgi:hypothetical protein